MRKNRKIIYAFVLAIALISSCMSRPELGSPAFAPSSSRILLPAIDADTRGTQIVLDVGIFEGKGEVEFDSQNGTITYSQETQQSLLTASKVAEKHTGISLSDKHITFSIRGATGLISGRSAGAAAALATIAALKRERLRGDALITGGIDPKGNILRAGKILAKARAVKESGFGTLLVPAGEAKLWLTPETCQQPDGRVIYRCKPEKIEIDIAKETGINIVEVADIREASKIMTS